MPPRLIDSNVFIDIANEAVSPDFARWSLDAVADAGMRGLASVNQIIYAECSFAFGSVQKFDRRFPPDRVHRLDLPWEAAPLAAAAFLRYRRAGGTKTSPLPDFFIGAHAEVAGLVVVTRDPKPFRSYFPAVELIAPEGP